MDKSYLELLKDPRWQRKRLEILQRDDFHCQSCFDGESTLHVHHCYYRKGAMPWEYENTSLMTLCESCHDRETAQAKAAKTELIEALGAKGWLAEDFSGFANGVRKNHHEKWAVPIGSMLEWAFQDSDMFHAMYEAYMAHLRAQRSARGPDNEGA